MHHQEFQRHSAHSAAPAHDAPPLSAVERARLRATATFKNALVLSDPHLPDNPIVYANAAFLELSGYSEEELVGHNCRFLQGPGTDRDEVARLRQAIRDVRPVQVTLLNYRKDGTTFWNELTVAPVRGDRGELTHFVAVQTDVSVLKGTERQLRQKAEELSAVVEQAMDGVYLFDPDSKRLLKTNAAFRAMLGHSEEQAAALTLYDIAGNDRDGVDRDVAALRRDGEASLGERQYLRRDGSVIVAEVRGRVIHHGDGAAFCVAAHDVTARRREEEARREAEEGYRALFESAAEGIFQTSAEGRCLRANPALARIYGYDTPEQAMACLTEIGDRLSVDAGRRDEFARLMRERGSVSGFESRVRRRDGSVIWISENTRAVYDEAGRLLRHEGLVEDVTERKLTEEALRERTEILESVLATVPHQVFWKDRHSVYLGGNVPFARFAGLPSPEQLVGKTDHDLSWRPEEVEDFLRLDRRVLEGGETILDVEQTYRFPDGRQEVALTSKLPLHDAQGRVIGVLGVSQDITERKALEAEREQLLADALERADRDPLTGLWNHRAFHRRLEEEAGRAEREGTVLAVVILDLDNFKFFNDAHGHVGGDAVLRQVAGRLEAVCRPYDTIARFGGDEFALLLPGVGSATAGEMEARLRRDLGAIVHPQEGQDAVIPITVSVGAALLPALSLGRQDLLRQADERLRRAKTGGDAETEADRVRLSATGAVAGFSMLDALVTAVDNKDRYTRRHSEDVMTHSLTIAHALGMGEKEQRNIAVAALLHDVGKIGVPDAVLRKPGRLTDEEFGAIRQHPTMGAALVSTVPGLEATLDAVRHHHERWDGGGYPAGLRGEGCPLMARLMAVADAFSAMTMDRPYRQGMPHARALAILAEGAGTQWDPQCVSAFLTAMPGHAPLGLTGLEPSRHAA